MDYGASIHEAEDPAGASPWVSSPASSPQQNRSGFQNMSGEQPPFPFAPQASNGLDQVVEAEGFQRPGTANAESGTETEPGAPATLSPAASQQPPVPPAGGPDPHAGSVPTSQRQGQAAGSHAQPDQAQQPQRPSQPYLKLQAKITGLERTGKKDPVLRFDIHTNLPRFRTTQYRDVRRLHSEFVKLAAHLISANPEALVPAVPPPVTAAGAGTDEDETRVKAMMQRWFNCVCSNDVLMRDDEMILFVESDFGYSPMVKMKQPATGVRRKILKQFAPPPDDTPELADARPAVKLFYLGTMDAGHKVDRMVKARRGLGLAESDFGVKLGSMNVQEPHPGLANAFRKLGRTVQTVGDYHAAQATAEATTMGDPFQYHSQDAFIVKESLTNRQILTREFLQAQDVTRSKLNAADRLKASSSVRREKVDEAIAALDDARQSEMNLHHKTARVTKNLVLERRKWFTRTAADLRMSIRDFVLREIEAERRTLAVLETVRPDIRSIDGSGGLSPRRALISGRSCRSTPTAAGHVVHANHLRLVRLDRVGDLAELEPEGGIDVVHLLVLAIRAAFDVVDFVAALVYGEGELAADGAMEGLFRVEAE
ncbi:vacuolar protein sorting-associated protein vps17 [Ophiocordyceps sinensis CO18]|uniref:Vacuolar protein sorting-associated protein 17 n=1 Tax=Ophiocordyceps sinensis (strain Co18 / CGMCC 3.14243) TaxID=911162 RepID=T5A0Y8_OPHSC|nr:vacuolar protein sorting-associated protein vps17 [Ophiocordyceps sinensis CO18]